MEQNNNENSKRFRILQEDEIRLIYDKPKFSLEERDIYFDLSKKELSVISLFRSFDVKINFMLQLAYFKAKNRFFSFEIEEIKYDLNYIIEKYFNNKNIDIESINNIGKNSWYENQKKILSIFKYSYFDDTSRIKLEEKILNLVRISAKPIYIFKQIYNFLNETKIIIPSYSTMQDYISNALYEEESRLIKLIEKNSNSKFTEEIDNLLVEKNDSYEITFIKKPPKDFKYREMKKEIERLKKIKLIYRDIKSIIDSFNVSPESIKYYSSLVNFYDVSRLKILDINTVRIYIICFLYHRFHNCNDNLINALIHHVRQFDEGSKSYACEKILQHKIDATKHVTKAGKILRIFIDKSISDEEIFLKTKNRAFRVLDEEKISIIADYIENKAMFDDMAFKFEYIEKNSRTYKINLRQIIANVDFFASSKKSSLLDAINKLKYSLSIR